MAEKYFGKVKTERPGQHHGSDKPIYEPGLLFLPEEEMENPNIGVFYDAPDWFDKDYYSFLMLQRIFSSYNIEENVGHLNSVLQSNASKSVSLGEIHEMFKHECIYSPYFDAAIFGHYFNVEQISNQSSSDKLNGYDIYSPYVTDIKVSRARNKLFQELMQIQTVSDVLQSIGPQILYLDRRVHRSEIAQRVANMGTDHMHIV